MQLTVAAAMHLIILILKIKYFPPRVNESCTESPRPNQRIEILLSRIISISPRSLDLESL